MRKLILFLAPLFVAVAGPWTSSYGDEPGRKTPDANYVSKSYEPVIVRDGHLLLAADDNAPPSQIQNLRAKIDEYNRLLDRAELFLTPPLKGVQEPVSSETTDSCEGRTGYDFGGVVGPMTLHKVYLNDCDAEDFAILAPTAAASVLCKLAPPSCLAAPVIAAGAQIVISRINKAGGNKGIVISIYIPLVLSFPPPFFYLWHQ